MASDFLQRIIGPLDGLDIKTRNHHQLFALRELVKRLKMYGRWEYWPMFEKHACGVQVE